MSYFALVAIKYSIPGIAGEYIVLSYKQYAGFLAITVNLIAFFFFRQHYKVAFLTTLALGLINVIQFSAIDSTIGFEVGGIKVGFQSTSILIAFLTYFLNFTRFNNYLKPNPGQL